MAGYFGDPSTFNTLVRFIDDWDRHAKMSQTRGGQQGQQQRQPSRSNSLLTYTPRFDVMETPESFELHGELPGVDKNNVSIEFTEPQTIVIKGSSERTYSAGTKPGNLLDTSMSGAITLESHDDEHASGSHQPTVEDDNEGNESTTVTHNRNKPESQEQQQQQQKPKGKYWVYEREIGSFQRTFSFSSRVDQDNVHAKLENGILHVTVPKAKKPESRRIAIH
ncbi:HSP20-like chaperone [Poronia punctata]|nr:HSP20-like chaperone [Poronia punctata]